MRPIALTLVPLATLMLAAAVPSQQAPEREMQTGVKTSDEVYAAVAEIQVKFGVPGQGEDAVGKAIRDLFTQVTDAGFTPLGQIRVAVVSPLPPPADGSMALQVRIPVIEQPTEQDLQADAPLSITKLEATRVAYTYHKGSIQDVQLSFARLIQWIMAQKLEIAGAPFMIIHATPDRDPMKQVAELQIPVK